MLHKLTVFKLLHVAVLKRHLARGHKAGLEYFLATTVQLFCSLNMKHLQVLSPPSTC